MKNIIKSIWYEILRSKFMIRIYLLFVGVMVLMVLLNLDTMKGKGISYFLADNPTSTYLLSFFVLAFIVGIISGEDYKDKVANYEILSGHSRISVFFTRSLMGILVGSFLCVVLNFVILITGCILAGWGESLSMGDVIVRQLLFFFPFMRLGAFLVVLTFLIKNPYIIMAAGFVIGNAGMMLQEMFGIPNSLYISIFNMGLLTEYGGWSIYNIDPGLGIVHYNAYDSSLTIGLVVGTVVVSLVMTAFYLFMGYALFRRDELN